MVPKASLAQNGPEGATDVRKTDLAFFISLWILGSIWSVLAATCLGRLNSITSPDPLPPPASDDEAEEDADGDAEVHGRQNGTHVGNVTEEEEELLPTESFDYVDSDVADDDNDSEQDVSSSDQM